MEKVNGNRDLYLDNLHNGRWESQGFQFGKTHMFPVSIFTIAMIH